MVNLLDPLRRATLEYWADRFVTVSLANRCLDTVRRRVQQAQRGIGGGTATRSIVRGEYCSLGCRSDRGRGRALWSDSRSRRSVSRREK